MTSDYKELPVENIFAWVQLTPLTTAQRDALVPSAGMVVFNVDTDVLEFYNGTTWGAV